MESAFGLYKFYKSNQQVINNLELVLIRLQFHKTTL